MDAWVKRGGSSAGMTSLGTIVPIGIVQGDETEQGEQIS